MLKVRLVGKEFLQIYRVDYSEAFFPLTKVSTLRVLMGWVAVLKLKNGPIDIKKAFLNSKIQEDIYLELPTLLVEVQKKFNYYTWQVGRWRLLKNTYGLKQGSKALNTKFHKLIIRFCLNCPRLIHACTSREFMEFSFLWISTLTIYWFHQEGYKIVKKAK